MAVTIAYAVSASGYDYTYAYNINFFFVKVESSSTKEHELPDNYKVTSGKVLFPKYMHMRGCLEWWFAEGGMKLEWR